MSSFGHVSLSFSLHCRPALLAASNVSCVEKAVLSDFM